LTSILQKELDFLYFSNNYQGFDELWSHIVLAKAQGGFKKVILGFESTGPYGQPLQHFFLQRSVRLVQVNPMHTKKAKDICGNSPLKSDKKDARVIAKIISMGEWISQVIPKGARADLRELTKSRNKDIRDRTAHYNRLRQSHHRLFPEFGTIIKDIKTKTAQYLLKKYTVPENFCNLEPEELGKELKKVSRGRFGLPEAKALIEASETSIGIKEGVAGISLEIRQIIEQLELLNRFIATIEEKMKFFLKIVPESKIIMSVKGFKEISAASIIGEVGDFEGFSTRDEILKFAGLAIFEVSSGIKKGLKKITKVGRNGLRNTLYFASLNTVRKGGIMHDEYKKYIDRGMPKTKAIIAISRKLLRIIFSLVKNNTMYMENYEELKLMKKAA
jgi:transposase